MSKRTEIDFDQRSTRKRGGRTREGKAPAKRRGLVGSFFHSYRPSPSGRRIQQQGFVLERVSAGLYFVQWFSWLDGRCTSRELVKLDVMLEWTFYPDAEEMKHAYETEPGT